MKLRRQTYPVITRHVTNEHLKGAYEEIGNIVNGGLEFGSPVRGPINVDGQWWQGATPSAADTDFMITHSLQRVPTGALTFSIDRAGIVYRSPTAWTTTAAYLRCNVSGANVIVFLT